MVYYYKKQVAASLGIRVDTFKKNLQAGVYDHILGPVETDHNGWRIFSEQQVDALKSWYAASEVKLRCIALGGGVQSTAMLLMHLHHEWDPQPDCTMFVDLGWESQATYENLHRLKTLCEADGFPFYWIKGRNIRDDLIEASRDPSFVVKSPPLFLHGTQGGRGQLARNCTASYKIEVMRAKIRKLLSIPARRQMRYRVEVWLGITTDEAYRLNNNSRIPWINNRFPLTDENLSRDDCKAWLKAHGHPVPPKSSCLGCPYRPDADWGRMKAESEEEWHSVLEVDRAIRSGINKVRVPLFIHPSLQPMDEVEFERSEHKGLWGEECTGYCAT